METVAWTYILSNEHYTTLNVGATIDLRRRLWEHRTKFYPKSFTAHYNIYQLLYFESFDSVDAAFEREKYIKGKTRKWKEDLIESINPQWIDLSDRFI